MDMAQETTLLTRDAMDRIAAAQGVTLNVKKRPPYAHVYLRDHGTLIYLGHKHLLEQLSEDAFAEKVAEKLARATCALEDV